MTISFFVNRETEIHNAPFVAVISGKTAIALSERNEDHNARNVFRNDPQSGATIDNTTRIRGKGNERRRHSRQPPRNYLRDDLSCETETQTPTPSWHHRLPDVVPHADRK
jgi:hypothetical protein